MTTSIQTTTPGITMVSGLGDAHAHFNVYMGNRPDFDFKSSRGLVHPVSKGEIYACGQACGNGWRKVFNVYAKLVFACASEILGTNEYRCWQDYRDQKLLQLNSGTSLMFTPPSFAEPAASAPPAIHIIMGRTYANSLPLPQSLKWLDTEFAIDYEHQVIVCPYFDYRQLSNVKIIRLVELIAELKSQKVRYEA